ncbi:S41 family peptidase [Dactylosporangium matsuzakiense]|uniref:Interphotoreceptor retinoid-binding protein n=1 Tax=Dactylosporangium matsuzakiense TaxID=53360 RepID=A0A9W6KR19_9ACTN|nr:S41 family peptidase [Dactylosporangium matsuzakiense]UWZ41308.1 S41 family peptidase [Dactylosporangium matsuzakiense]GLL05688.1 interphotoreceptor retinoid-binding protein [Dactylosporangium matsuzakiense]
MSANLVEKALELLCGNYIFADRAQEAADGIRRRLAAGEYDRLDEEALGRRLTAELFEVCQDKHLRVRTRTEEMREALTEAEMEAVWREQQRLTNYGIARVERLDGNVGLLDLRFVTAAGMGGRAIAAAMELVSQTHALIVDLRRNRGGFPDGALFWMSYFFPDGETHLNDIYEGATGHTRQFWSHAWLPGERYLDRPVYLLTSESTFSGGEDICYNLQAQGRAVLVGATTKGGAHPTEAFPITPTFEITVPVARSINPVTGGNWEGTGVVPDVAVATQEAFDVAYRMALQHVLASATSPAVLAEARAALQ